MLRKMLISGAVAAAVGLSLLLSSLRAAEPAKEAAPAAGQPQITLPPGWTAEDVQACILAGTPGKMQEYLARSVGVWRGTSTTWMGPGAEGMKSPCTLTIRSIMDGHYTQAEMTGDMPGVGPYKGMGLYGFDNVSRKFNSAWVDNQNTGIIHGVGELSKDEKTMNWTSTYNCPINKKPTPMRQIETVTGPLTKTLEIYSIEPKSGKEYKMMAIELTKE